MEVHKKGRDIRYRYKYLFLGYVIKKIYIFFVYICYERNKYDMRG